MIGQGKCISLTNELIKEEYYLPCEGKDTTDGHESYGSCQAGASVDVFVSFVLSLYIFTKF